ncbi:MAG: DUF11 domain-containing protein [Gammaproteobacteria bacterium]|nr:DUF11 domain-containing protein [Gammaproteobacteria bacterium]
MRMINAARLYGRHIAGLLALFTVLLLPWQAASAGVPITLYQSFAGDMNYVETGGTLRTQSNAGDSCAVTNSNSAVLSGIPAGSTITAAYLYWAGSGSTPDNNVSLDGVAISADRTFSETFTNGGTNYDFFSGFEDITSQVAAKGNGTYTFSNLTVNTGAPHCAVQAVLSGWGMLVVYENVIEPLRVINIFDGFRYFRGGSITLTPDNFTVPSTGIDGRHGILTWEGDVENSASLNGFNETLSFNGTALTDAFNPANNQFNSTINVLSSNTTYGVDLDVYDVSGLLSPGDTSASSVYSSGADLVLLSMEVLSVTNTAVADLAISKTHSGNFTVGQNGTFTLDVSNNGPSTASGTITVTDTLPAGLGYVSASGSGWTCGAAGQDVTCTYAGPLANGASLPSITLTVSVASAAVPSVINTATVANGTFDNKATNNSSSDTVVVQQPDLSTSTKTVVDLNGGDADPGDTLRYTISLIESGGVAASGVSVTDNLPANTTGLSVVSVPGGATDNSTGVLLDVSNISVSANSTATIVFDVTISGSANPGDTIDNTATVTNPNGPGATPAAPTVTVSASQVSASGNKPLYLSSSTLSRNPPGAVGDVTINKGAAANWTIAPALATNLTVDGSSGQIPVTLILGETGGGQQRSFTVSLSSSAIGTFATQSFTNVGLDPTLTATYALNLTTPGDKVLPAGSTITLTIANNTTGGGTRSITVTPPGSFVNLPSKTVINVDSVAFYDAAYPGGSVLTTVAPNTTVYVRAVVSDPFGSFDITSSTVTITDPTPVTQVSLAAMTEVADSGAATKTYEYAYTIPANATGGNWVAQVISHEGTEGTISHQHNASLIVSSASLSVSKTVQTVSDPVNGTSVPYNLPGATLRYTIRVINSGAGNADTDTVVMTDPVPANTQLCVATVSNCVAPAFSDGTTTSGLAAAAFEYSFVTGATACDNASFIGTSPTADGNGYDANVTCIRQRPTGSMNGSGAFFDVQLTAGIQ